MQRKCCSIVRNLVSASSTGCSTTVEFEGTAAIVMMAAAIDKTTNLAAALLVVMAGRLVVVCESTIFLIRFNCYLVLFFDLNKAI